MSNKNGIMDFFEKVNNSIATKLCANLPNNRKNEWFLVHYKIKLLNFVVHYLNVKKPKIGFEN